MIFSSIALMTALDVLIIGACIFAYWFLFANRSTVSNPDVRRGFVLIVSGLSAKALLYAADLAVMYALPFLVPMSTAMAVMESLHLEYSWIASVLSIGLILAGLVANVQSVSQAIESSEVHIRRFSDVAEVAGDWIWEMDADLRFTFLSDRIFDIFPVTRDEILGHTRTDLYAGDPDDPLWLAHLDDLENRRPFRDFEYLATTPDGVTKHLVASGNPVFDEAGEFRGYRGTGTDRTAEVEARRILQDREKAHARVVAALEQSTEYIALYDADDRLLFSNQAWRDFNEQVAWTTKPGVTFEEHLRAMTDAGIIADAKGREEDWVAERLARHRAPDGPIVVHRENGTWTSTTEKVLDDRSTILVISDITSAKVAEQKLREQYDVLVARDEALKESNERFNAALENMSQGLAMFDKSERLVVCNEKYASMYGLTTEQVKPGTMLMDIIEHRIAAGIYVARNADEFMDEQLSWQDDGEHRWLIHELADGRHMRLTHHILPDGGWVATHEDVSEFTIMNQVLHRQKAELNQILTNVPSAVVTANPDGIIMTFNPTAQQIFGYTQEEAVGRNIRILLPEKEAEPYIRYLRIHSDAGGGLTREAAPHRMTGRRKDGSKFPMELGLGKAGEGSDKRFIAVVNDVTEELEAKTRLIEHRDTLQQKVDEATADLEAKARELEYALAKEKELNELQRQFVSMASHEFRTPLSIIDQSAQIVLRHSETNRLKPDALERRMGKVRAAVKRMTKLMETTLTSARLEDGKVQVEAADCNIRQLVEELCSRQIEIDMSHNIVCDVEALPPRIQADIGAIDQILTNLLSNAAKYSPNSPDIQVTGRTDGDYVEILVRDYGLGIDEDDLSKMFTRFFRARSSAGIAGTGIGLHTAKMLAELHDGSLSVDSKKGEGSVFTLRLPIRGPASVELIVSNTGASRGAE